MNSLAPHTSRIFDAVSQLNCIKGYVLVGGTALSLQINSRESEDLDFMRWRISKNQKPEVNWVQIEKELRTISSNISTEILDFYHVEFIVDNVKISFYISDRYSPVSHGISFRNNLVIADVTSIAAMKMEVMLRRTSFRDYYDIYSLLRHGVDFKQAVELALNYSGHKLSTKNLLSILSDSSRFKVDSSFKLLNPVYDVQPEEIEQLIKKYSLISFR